MTMPGSAHRLATTPSASLEDVTVSYGDEVVLRGVDLAVRAGESLALTGPSGSGKSSLLLVLAGLLRPTAGRVRLLGKLLDLDRPEQVARTRRDEIGIVFQFGELVPQLSLVENVALPLRLAGQGRRAAESLARERLADLGVLSAADRSPDQASGGQVQRAAIARAVIHGPSIVLADEPTGSLGIDHSGVVADLLFETVRSSGAALVIATHEAGLAARADRSMIIGGRQIVEPRDAAPQ